MGLIPVPVLAQGELRSEGELGYYVGIVLDELVAQARGAGCSEEELRERLEESLERFDDEDDDEDDDE